MTTPTDTTEISRRLVEELYDAAVAADVEGVLFRLDDSVIVHEPDFLPYGGEYHGKQGFVDLYTKIAKVYDVAKIRVDYLVADGDRVIGVIRMPDLNTGNDVLLAEQSTVRDGKVIDMRIFFHDTQSLIGAPKL
jgi:predicted SnoaL-like aldol condensation-catalyzing enzyme